MLFYEGETFASIYMHKNNILLAILCALIRHIILIIFANK